jgi:hypothetical protein
LRLIANFDALRLCESSLMKLIGLAIQEDLLGSLVVIIEHLISHVKIRICF